MSHIDSFHHEIVGMLGNISVYHPLEEINGDFNANPNQLILGGGSGEHPAMVVEDTHAAVAFFLHEWLIALKDKRYRLRDYPLKAKINEWMAVIEPFLKEPEQIVKFYQWDDETWKNFQKLCNSYYIYNTIDRENILEWIILGFGEFIFYAMPELSPEIMKKLEDPYSYFNHSYYNSILLIPPNFPVYASGGNAFFPKKS